MREEHRLFTTTMGTWEKDIIRRSDSNMVWTNYTFHFYDYPPITVDIGNADRVGVEHYFTPLYGESIQVEFHRVEESSGFDGTPLDPSWLEIRVLTGKYSGETLRVRSDWAWEDSYEEYKEKVAR